MFPSSSKNSQYYTIYDSFKNSSTFRHLVVFAKPQCKMDNSKKNLYQDSIFKPSYMKNDHNNEQSIFLNGKVQTKHR
jgi:hypothetical protein